MFQKIRASQRVWIAYWIGIVVALLIALVTLMEQRTEHDEARAHAEVRHWRRVAIERAVEDGGKPAPASEPGKSDGSPTE